MQTKVALLGLALVNSIVAGPCKPNRQTTSALGTASITETTTDVTSDVPSLTVSQQTTTTQESDPIITNDIVGGSFASRDPNNPPSGLTGFVSSGDASFHQGGCYKADGSLDDGCAALTATGNPAGKRDVGSFASISQTLALENTGSRNKYTVQFYYIVASGGSQACTVSASLGSSQFYSNSLSSSGQNMLWVHVLQQVEADSSSAVFTISMACSGNGESKIFVDSVFVSNQVTPENINDFKLDLGGPTPQPTTSQAGPLTSVVQPTSRPKPSTMEQPTTSLPEPITMEQPTTSQPKPSTMEQPTTGQVEPSDKPSTASFPDGPHTAFFPETTEAEGLSSQTPPTSAEPTAVEPTTKPTESVCKPTCDIGNDLESFTCKVFGIWSGPTYTQPGNNRNLNIVECAAICKTIPGCQSAGISYNDGSCRFSNHVVKESEVQPGDDSRSIQWWQVDCFACSGCASSPETTVNPNRVTTKAPTDSQPTTLATTTSPPPKTTTSPADTCLYNRGQTCEFNRFKDHSDTLCIYAALFTGETWKESREDYPFQDDLYQCAAICQTLENCASSGYYSTENRCLFTSKKLQTSDMVLHLDRPYDHSVWSHNSCFTCPDCETSSEPVVPGWMCSYEQGDTCKRVSSSKSGALCNYQGMFEAYIQEDLERYPDQSSPAKCAAICLTQTYCKASGYKDGRCMFAVRDLKPENFRLDWPDHSRDGTWDDISCFECPGCQA
ncbi:hypothetical protein FHETE_6387 [Fusarium heterosporum]|uniref:Apple domain-containing protein n=1 Tax=Fusarium heterosporum TaxID=42747 RepID=A0A8H5T7M0_FUSHE|nr:hypothetical protein FHETE_6387 [Fusarium heterosporum]